MAFGRWRPKLGRSDQRLALDLRLSDPRPSARSEYHLDAATQRRHGGTFSTRCAAAVWRSRDGGQSWQAMRQGLPQKGCFFTVLRQAMAGDERDPAGIYFGTNSGSVFASFDEGVELAGDRTSLADDTCCRSTRTKIKSVRPIDSVHLPFPPTVGRPERVL